MTLKSAEQRKQGGEEGGKGSKLQSGGKGARGLFSKKQH